MPRENAVPPPPIAIASFGPSIVRRKGLLFWGAALAVGEDFAGFGLVRLALAPPVTFAAAVALAAVDAIAAGAADEGCCPKAFGVDRLHAVAAVPNAVASHAAARKAPVDRKCTTEARRTRRIFLSMLFSVSCVPPW